MPPSSVSPSRQAWFIVNPVAGGLPSRAKLHDAIAVAAARFGFEPRVEYTTAPGHATQLAAEAEAALSGWVASGAVRVVEDVVEGLENAPAALIGLLAGENRGKRMVRVAPDPA